MILDFWCPRVWWYAIIDSGYGGTPLDWAEFIVFRDSWLIEQVVTMAMGAFAYICFVWELHPFLDEKAVLLIIPALVTSCLDYFNVLYIELSL